MSPEKDNVKMLKEHLASWNLGEAVRLALNDDAALRGLFRLLHDHDDDVKIRALMTLEEVLKALPDVKRLFLMREFLGDLIKTLKSDNDAVSLHSLKVMAGLIEGIPLEERDFIELASVLKDLVRARRSEVVLLEIPPILKNMRVTAHTPRLTEVISRLLRSKNPRLKAMGLRLLLNTSAYTGKASLLKLIFSEIPEMLSGKDVPLADFVLDILLEISDFPLNEELIEDVATVLSTVKNIALRKSPELGEKAKIVAEKLEERINRYYRGRPEAAREKIHELLINERFYEAIDLALAVGDTYVLKWLAETLKKMEKESLKVSERVLPGPKYLSPPPEAKAQKSLKVPHVSQFRGGKVDRGKLTGSLKELGSDSRMPDEETKRELEEVISSGKTSQLTELMLKKPEIVFELERRLKEGNKFEKMDALWALSKLAEKLDSARSIILKPVEEALIELSNSRNRWVRLRAVRTLSILASKAAYGDEIVRHFLDEYLSRECEEALPSLEFFSYYFEAGWDEKTAGFVLSRLPEYLEKETTCFDALLTLEALVRSAPVEKVHLLKPFIGRLKEIKKTASPEEQKLALRVLESIAEKSKALLAS